MSMINQANLSAQSLFALVNEVHDYYFDIDMVKWEPQHNKFQLFVGPKRKGSHAEKELIAGGVDSVAFEDDDKIGTYVLTDIVVHEASKEVIFEATGLTIRIRIGPGWYIEVATLREGGDP